MGFRTVVIKSRAKLETRLNYLIIRAENECKIFIDEINTLIIQSTAVAVTAALLCELIKHNVKVIFCDEKCNPQSELLPYYGAHNTPKRYLEQINWSEENKNVVWQSIIKQKIKAQASFLSEKGFFEQSEMLCGYAENVLPNDITNREGHAAKVYFNCLLKDGYSRRSGGFVNGCLNYGYAVLTSAFNREIAASGYLTQLGIKHCNEFNEFNLACDFIEPFRPIVDKTALSLKEGDKDFKRKMANVLNYSAMIDDKNTTLDIAIKIYVKSLFNALNEGDVNLILFPQKIKHEL
ncbi:MAG: type II CRISPR-associated endonuclease Cas1 [Clostridia bacterium]|nr:type II CRISPR-associated endonuclease Cas1 [Clostridia bacterium]